MKTQLIIPDILAQAHLGCLPAEREYTQEVRFSIAIEFAEMPTTCSSDEVKEVPCYAEMADILAATIKKKHYKTIEHLGLTGYKDLQNYLKAYDCARDAKLKVKVNKVNPPVDTIVNGCHFQLEGSL